jgi:hypothetical protein
MTVLVALLQSLTIGDVMEHEARGDSAYSHSKNLYFSTAASKCMHRHAVVSAHIICLEQ